MLKKKKEKVVNRQSRDITSSANFEGVLEDDMNLEQCKKQKRHN